MIYFLFMKTCFFVYFTFKNLFHNNFNLTYIFKTITKNIFLSHNHKCYYIITMNTHLFK